MDHLRGKFIVFDGGEGCGKSTQIRLLRQALHVRGIEPLVLRDPGTTRIGEQIRQVLLNPDHTEMAMRCEMLLYMAARAQMLKEFILPALDCGKVVLCDRFVSSTLAYQLGGDGLTDPEIRTVADIALRGRWPDLTIILDMPIEASSARVQAKFVLFDKLAGDIPPEPSKDRIERRPPEYHAQVRQNYLAQARSMPDRYRVVSADQPVEAVHQSIIEVLMKWRPES